MKSDIATICMRLNKTRKEVLDVFGEDLYYVFNFYFSNRLKTMRGDENPSAEIKQTREDLNFILKTRSP